MINPKELNKTVVITRIKQLRFFLNERAFINDPNRQLDMKIGISLSHVLNNNFVSLEIRLTYKYFDIPDVLLVDTLVQTVFDVKNLSDYVVAENTIKLPLELMGYLIEISTNHTRALLAVSLSGSLWQDNIFGFSDGQEMAKHFFPEMFKNEIPQEEPIKKYRATAIKDKAENKQSIKKKN